MSAPNATPDIAQHVKALKKGSQSAFEDLIRMTERRLYRFCLLMSGDESKAQDLCQETYIKALQGIHSLKNDSAFMTWLLTIARGLYLDYVKSPQNKNVPLDELDPPAEAWRHDLKEIVIRFLGKLSEEDRAVILLVDMEDYSYKEAAQALGISQTALGTRLERARKRFAESVRQEGVEITGIIELGDLRENRKKSDDAA